MTTLPTDLFVDLLFQRKTPVWHLWDGNTDATLQALFSRATSELADERKNGYTINLALWLLDKLLPLDQLEPFLPFLGELTVARLDLQVEPPTRVSKDAWKRAIYAWGRRLPAEQRMQLLQLPFEERPDEAFYTGIYHMALAAWCDSCPHGEQETLFLWPDACKPYHHTLPHGSTRPIVEAYIERTPNRQERIERLSYLATELKTRWSLTTVSGHTTETSILHDILLHLAIDLGRASDHAQAPLLRLEQDFYAVDWWSWFLETLRGDGRPELADLYSQSYQRPGHHWPAALFWLERCTEQDWPDLISHVQHRGESWAGMYQPMLERLACLIPKHRLDVWRPLLRGEHQDDVMRAFCSWLSEEYRDVLLLNASHGSSIWYDDGPVQAFHGYLYKTPRPVLEELWEQTLRLASWQTQSLDRYLFAPDAIKPQAVVPDRQTVEGDMRLNDPLSPRGE